MYFNIKTISKTIATTLPNTLDSYPVLIVKCKNPSPWFTNQNTLPNWPDIIWDGLINYWSIKYWSPILQFPEKTSVCVYIYIYIYILKNIKLNNYYRYKKEKQGPVLPGRHVKQKYKTIFNLLGWTKYMAGLY